MITSCAPLAGSAMNRSSRVGRARSAWLVRRPRCPARAACSSPAAAPAPGTGSARRAPSSRESRRAAARAHGVQLRRRPLLVALGERIAARRRSARAARSPARRRDAAERSPATIVRCPLSGSMRISGIALRQLQRVAADVAFELGDARVRALVDVLVARAVVEHRHGRKARVGDRFARGVRSGRSSSGSRPGPRAGTPARRRGSCRAESMPRKATLRPSVAEACWKAPRSPWHGTHHEAHLLITSG